MPLMSMLLGIKKGKKSGPYDMTPEAGLAFWKLKSAFARAPVLQYFDLERPIHLEMDTS